jgi:hypothetical protein
VCSSDLIKYLGKCVGVGGLVLIARKGGVN